MRRSPLTILCLTVFIDLLGFGIILPLLPFYAQSFGATGLWVGALLTAYSAAQFVGASALGRLSDRFGRRPVLLLSLAGSALSLTLTGFANSLALLLLGRALAGLFGGSITTAQAYMADVSKPSERAKHMGMLGASIGMGFVFGPAIGAALSHYGFGAAAFVAAGLAAANLIFAFFALPESRPAPGAASPAERPERPSFLTALRHPTVGRILASTFLTTFAFVSLEATFALFEEKRIGLDAGGLGLIFTYLGILIVIVQGGIIGRLNARYGERGLAAAGSVMMGVALLAIPLAPAVIGIHLVVLGLLAIGQGLVTPTLSSLLSREAGVDQQGSVLGFGQSLSAGARGIGPILAGVLFDRGIGLPYFTGAVLVLAAAWLIGQRVLQPAEAIATTGK